MSYSYDRRAAAPDLSQLQGELDALQELSSTLDGIEEAFDAHYRAAGLVDPKVESQTQVIKKSQEGLKAAQAILAQANEVLKHFPDDKAALKVKAEAERMAARFEKHMAEGRKIIRAISKKLLPPRLKKEAAVAARIILDRLVDPTPIDIFPWHGETFSWVGREQVKFVQFVVVFRLGGDRSKDWVLTENLGTVEPGIRMRSPHGGSSGETTGKEFATKFLASLKGWPGLKGETEATAARAPTARAIATVLNSVCRRLKDYDVRDAEVSADNLTIQAEYRSSLPKEGERAVGEFAYREMVGREIARCRKALDQALAPYKGQIAEVDVHDGEKSWIYVAVTLK